MTFKRCTSCGLSKPETDFSTGARYTGGRRARCKACELEKRIIRRERDTRREDEEMDELERKTAADDELIGRMAAAAIRWDTARDRLERITARALVVYLAERITEAVA